METPLTIQQYHELKLWLKSHNMSSKRRCQSYAKCSKFAKFVAKFHPLLVELGDYPWKFTKSGKLENWKKLNSNVLRRIGLQQSERLLLDVVNGEDFAIIKILYQLMKNEKYREAVKEYEQLKAR